MLSLLPTDQNKKRKLPRVDVQMVQKSMDQTSSAVSVLLATSPLISQNDKEQILTHTKALNRILKDLAARSASISEAIQPLDVGSSDESMKRYLTDEKDTLTGIVTSTLNIAGKLRANNRMSEAQYQKVIRYYKALLQINDAIEGKLARATSL